MMSERKEYDYAIRTLAEQLYIFHGRTYEEISRETGVSEAQLKRWGKAGEWRAKRGQYLTSKSQILTRMIGVRDDIIGQLENEIQPHTVQNLLGALKQAESMIEVRINPGSADHDRPAIFLEDLRFIVDTVREVDPLGVQVLARNFDLILDRFKAARGHSQ